MSTLFVDTINEKTSGNGIAIPGHVVQVIHNTSGDGSELSVTGTTWTSGGAESTVTITPKFSTSKLLIMANFNADTSESDNRAMYTFFKSVNGGTYSNVVSANTQSYDALVRIHETGERVLQNQTMIFYDTPSSTSSHAYRVYFKNQNSGEITRLRNDITPSQLIAMEIAQ
jgi:hypothetical protein